MTDEEKMKKIEEIKLKYLRRQVNCFPTPRDENGDPILMTYDLDGQTIQWPEHPDGSLVAPDDLDEFLRVRKERDGTAYNVSV